MKRKRVIRTDWYSKTMLTMIALTLTLMCLRSAGIDWGRGIRKATGFELQQTWRPEPALVHIVQEPMPVHIMAIGSPRGQSRPDVPWRPLPVNVENEVDVNVENEVDVNVENTRAIPVKIER